MRYLFAVIADRATMLNANSQEATSIDAFNEKIDANGHRVMAVGIAGPDHAKLFDNRDGRGKVSERPAVDSDLFMAGFWIIEAETDSMAHELASEASRACNRLIEVRPLLR